MFIRNSSRTLLGASATPTGSIFDTPLDKAELESRGSTSLTMLEGKAVISETDMFRAMQQYALDLASKALDDYDITEATDIARFIKQEFDRTYGPGWQCIVGTDFGSFVTHRFGCFIYFCIGSLAILLFRASAGAEAPDANQFATSLESVKA